MSAATEVVSPEKVPTTSLKPFRFSTAPFPLAQQFDAWREFNSAVAELSLLEQRAGAFEAEQLVWDLGSFALTLATLPSTGCLHHWRHRMRAGGASGRMKTVWEDRSPNGAMPGR